MQRIKQVILHCSDSDFGCAAVIDQWHKERGWQGIGYHYVVLNGYSSARAWKSQRRFSFLDGSVECGRPLDADPWLQADEVGAHAYGYNGSSVGVCLIGRAGSFTIPQLYTARNLINILRWEFDLALNHILGHSEVTPEKTCPGLDMRIFREYLADDRKLEALLGRELLQAI